jgi:hypothetical protein
MPSPDWEQAFTGGEVNVQSKLTGVPAGKSLKSGDVVAPVNSHVMELARAGADTPEGETDANQSSAHGESPVDQG